MDGLPLLAIFISFEQVHLDDDDDDPKPALWFIRVPFMNFQFMWSPDLRTDHVDWKVPISTSQPTSIPTSPAPTAVRTMDSGFVAALRIQDRESWRWRTGIWLFLPHGIWWVSIYIYPSVGRSVCLSVCLIHWPHSVNRNGMDRRGRVSPASPLSTSAELWEGERERKGIMATHVNE